MFDDLSRRVRSNEVTGSMIGAAIEVHKSLGRGLLESACEECLGYELKLRRINFERQIELPLTYKGVRLDRGYRMDLVVEELINFHVPAVKDGIKRRVHNF